MENPDSDTIPDHNCSWELPSSSMSSGQLTDDPTKPYRKKYRSKSAVSTDPRSPYYTCQGLAAEESLRLGGRFTKAPSVSCVPGYDGTKYADAAVKSQLPFNGGIVGLNLSPNDPKAATIRQHYYPEGGWGYVVCLCAMLVEVIAGGLQASYGLLLVTVMDTFGKEATFTRAVLLGAASTAVTLLTFPVVASLSKRHSPRLLAILGGLLAALGCLFSSFASQFHQLFFSFGLVVGVGVGTARASAHIMVAQYFKRRREAVEVAVAAAAGAGLAAVPVIVARAVGTLGWRLGLQAITGMTSLTFILGIFYRPASLYHPQRRAILHLKGLQKRSKAKDKAAQKADRPPFFDLTVLRSRTVQILIAGSAVAAFGMHVPLMLLLYQGKQDGLSSDALIHLQAYLGLSCSLGSVCFGLLVVRNSPQCSIARHYLAQASLLVMALATLAFVSLREPSGFTLFAAVFGFFHGGCHYSVKMFTFEKVRARNFSRAWGYLQSGMAVPVLLGLPLAGYLNETHGDRTGFYFAAGCLLLGSLLLFLIDVHKRHVQRRKSHRDHPHYDDDPPPADDRHRRRSSSSSPRLSCPRLLQHPHDHHRPELTCISEEVMMDAIYDDCITSCNKEEKFLMLSEFENNLVNTQESSSEEVRARLAQKSPLLLEHCPNCLRMVPMEEDAPHPKKKNKAHSKKKDGGVCAVVQNDIIDEVTSSL